MAAEAVGATGRPGRRLLVMAAVAAGLAALALWTVPSRLEPEQHPREPLVRFDLGRIRAVSVHRRGAQLVLTRGSDGWTLSANGVVEPVASDRVEDFLHALADLVPVLEIGAGEDVDPAAFGLSPARGEVVVRGPDEQEVKIALGDRNPSLTGMYVQLLPGTNIVLVGAVLNWEIDKLFALIPRSAARPQKSPAPDESH